jgi:hypothetical protein
MTHQVMTQFVYTSGTENFNGTEFRRIGVVYEDVEWINLAHKI